MPYDGSVSSGAANNDIDVIGNDDILGADQTSYTMTVHRESRSYRVDCSIKRSGH
jgi:hypothetical protein